MPDRARIETQAERGPNQNEAPLATVAVLQGATQEGERGVRFS